MNLKKEFDNAISIKSFEDLLGDQRALYDLHYKKALIEGELPEFDKFNILIITEPWCGDSTAILPVLMKLLKDQNVEIKVALRDKNPELMDKFLTNGNQAIPIVLILNVRGDLLARFGPRPVIVQNIFEQHRAQIEAGVLEKKDVIRKIRTFYAKDRGKVITEEFIRQFNKVIQELHPNFSL